MLSSRVHLTIVITMLAPLQTEDFPTEVQVDSVGGRGATGLRQWSQLQVCTSTCREHCTAAIFFFIEFEC